MSSSGNIHWTEDEELLERFVLNRLTSGERGALEGHLRSCEHCQRAVKAERELVAGVKQLGREQLKSTLRVRLRDRDASAIPWTQIVSVAAVLVVVAGLGIYNRWFFIAPKQEVGQTEQQLEKKAGPSLAEEQPKVSPSDKQTAVEKPDEIAASKESAELASKAEGRKYADEETKGGRLNKISESQLAEKSLVQPSSAGAAGAPQAGYQEKKDVKVTGALRKEKRSLTDAFLQREWVEGTVLFESHPGDAARSEQEKKDRLLSRTQAEPTKSQSVSSQKIVQPFSQVIHQSGYTQRLTFVQQPFDSLPRGRQVGMSYFAAQRIQTLLERTDKGLKMTMYFDPPLDEEEFRQAQVEPITSDSLVVRLPNKQIGYKIPGGWYPVEKK